MASSISQHLSLENLNLNKIQQPYFVSCSTMVDLLGRFRRCPFPMALQGRFFGPQNLLVKTMHFMSPSAWKRSRSFWMQAKALEEWSFSVCFSCHCLKMLGHGMIWWSQEWGEADPPLGMKATKASTRRSGPPGRFGVSRDQEATPSP